MVFVRFYHQRLKKAVLAELTRERERRREKEKKRESYFCTFQNTVKSYTLLLTKGKS